MAKSLNDLKVASEGQKSDLKSHDCLLNYHQWYAISHILPTYCNVCGGALSGARQYGLSCEICRQKVHQGCRTLVTDNCKWTTFATIIKDINEEPDGSLVMPHQWMEGNLPVTSTCSVCRKRCGSMLRLEDWRCLWCHATVHTACQSQMPEACSLGPAKISVVPPTCIHSMDDVKSQGTLSPLLVFVNSKSGENQGVKFLRRLKQYLNPAQVFELSSTGPGLGLRLFRHFELFRILVCAGDGSVGWIFSEIDKLDMHKQCLVAVLPLGTGNDLARTLGWGSSCDDDTRLPQILTRYEAASIKMLDRWSVTMSERDIPVEDSKMSVTNDQKTVLSNFVEISNCYLRSIVETDDFQDVMSSSKTLCEKVDEFLVKISENVKHDERLALKCNIVRQKLEMLLDTLKDEEANKYGDNDSFQLLADIVEHGTQNAAKESPGPSGPDPVLQRREAHEPSNTRILCSRERKVLQSQTESVKWAIRDLMEHSAPPKNYQQEPYESLNLGFSPPDTSICLSPFSIPSINIISPSSSTTSSASISPLSKFEPTPSCSTVPQFDISSDEAKWEADNADFTAVPGEPLSALQPMEVHKENCLMQLTTRAHCEEIKESNLQESEIVDSCSASDEDYAEASGFSSSVTNCSVQSEILDMPSESYLQYIDAGTVQQLISDLIIQIDSLKTSDSSEPIAEGRPVDDISSKLHQAREEPETAEFKIENQDLSTAYANIPFSIQGPSTSLSFKKEENSNKSKKVHQENRRLPIINPLVKCPALSINAESICAAVNPLNPGETFVEKRVMNNYFGIGIDAKIALDFHNKREKHPKKCKSRTKNYLWYGVLGSKQLLQKTYKNFEQRIQLQCDGQRIQLPPLQGIVVLNIPSYMGGTNFWGGTKENDFFLAQSFDDRILEVAAVFGSGQMAFSRLINLQHHRIAQCQMVEIHILGEEAVPIQVDGEAWLQPPGTIRIIHKNRAQMLCRNRQLEMALKSWREKQQQCKTSIQREPTSISKESIIVGSEDIFSERESYALLTFIECVSSLVKWVELFIISHPTLGSELYAITCRAQKILEATYPQITQESKSRIKLAKLESVARKLHEEAYALLRSHSQSLDLREGLESKLEGAFANMEMELRRTIVLHGLDGHDRLFFNIMAPLQQVGPVKPLHAVNNIVRH
ncbi:unnamed protein product [Hermetia illucens]|uniref:Diacylglycerol kinase n=1 Tax=Hermetia illucens TaxID=343691 RepID=A0A7R8Z127_HERIL|nr:unnamed protein product [Hermetia illucens]